MQTIAAAAGEYGPIGAEDPSIGAKSPVFTPGLLQDAGLLESDGLPVIAEIACNGEADLSIGIDQRESAAEGAALNTGDIQGRFLTLSKTSTPRTCQL